MPVMIAIAITKIEFIIPTIQRGLFGIFSFGTSASVMKNFLLRLNSSSFSFSLKSFMIFNLKNRFCGFLFVLLFFTTKLINCSLISRISRSHNMCSGFFQLPLLRKCFCHFWYCEETSDWKKPNQMEELKNCRNQFSKYIICFSIFPRLNIWSLILPSLTNTLNSKFKRKNRSRCSNSC